MLFMAIRFIWVFIIILKISKELGWYKKKKIKKKQLCQQLASKHFYNINQMSINKIDEHLSFFKKKKTPLYL